MGLADFNGDGRVDILWREYQTGFLYIWMLNGGPAVVAGTGYTSRQPPNARQWTVINP